MLLSGGTPSPPPSASQEEAGLGGGAPGSGLRGERSAAHTERRRCGTLRTMGCGCGRLLGIVCPLLLLLMLLHIAVAQEPISTAGKCNTIYKGFAGCLISLGDSMAQSVRQQRDEEEEDGGQEAQELDTICRSWDEFHACASGVLSRCPEEAAAIWESLRQESRKIQFQGNLQELCSARGRLASAQGSPPAETNQATLRGSAPYSHPSILPLLALLLLLGAWA